MFSLVLQTQLFIKILWFNYQYDEYDCFSLLFFFHCLLEKFFTIQHFTELYLKIFYIHCFPFFTLETPMILVLSIIAFWWSGSDGGKWSVWEKYYVKVNEGNNTIWKLTRSIRRRKSNIMCSDPTDRKMLDVKENRRTDVTSSHTAVRRASTIALRMIIIADDSTRWLNLI